jgi:hypothetical protein
LTKALKNLSRRIRLELAEIERVVRRVQAGWQEYQTSGDELFLDSVALNLHSVYNGLERLFQGIATTVDSHLPDGDSWHRALLEQMTMEIPKVRPAVIADSTFAGLDNYRRFRHVVRNIYSYQLDPEQLTPLVDNLGETFSQVQQELLTFVDWLEQF